MKKRSGNVSRGIDAELHVPRFTHDEMRRGTMGKYAVGRNRFIELDEDVARGFPDADSVNEALRLVQRLREIGKKPTKRKSA